jgi:murein DD-endopeptidase MepM/ murein hydrolase activator NlpD
MTRLKSRRRRRSPFKLFLILFILLAGAGGYVFITYFEGEKPQISGNALPTYLGKKTPLSITVSDHKSGLRAISIFISQGGVEKEIFNQVFPRDGAHGLGSHFTEDIALEVEAKNFKLKEGEATLKVVATDYSLRGLLKGNSSEFRHTMMVDTKAPKISIIHSERYIIPGGAGIVIYKAQDTVSHGVQFNGHQYPGFPLTDGSDGKYISYIALPYTAEAITESVIIAKDAAGNITKKPFSTVLKRHKQKRDKIHVSDGFLAKKIPEFEEAYPEMEGDLLQKYLYVNRVVRAANNQQIAALCLNPDPKQLWSGKFIRMAGSGKAGFADHRTYYYKGQAIDKQVHLGMDIASTKHVDIKAAATGRVVFGNYLGIYGNMVMLDHGQGVFSLYSHLSQINSAVGDLLNQGDVLGKSGTSGMAGGDHLHFSMLVNGIFVTPKEWWDQHWIDVTIDGPVVDAKF